MALDEKALRKPGFVEGIRVRLGDGQEWSFPKPRLRLVPRKANGGVELRGKPAYSGKRQAELNAVLEAAASEDVTLFEWIRVRTELAAGLLLDNYDLDDDALEELLSVDLDDAANEEMWGVVTAAILGQAHPKATTAG